MFDDNAFLARQFIEEMKAGAITQEDSPPACGEWQTIVDSLCASYQTGLVLKKDIKAAVKLFEKALQAERKAHPELDLLMQEVPASEASEPDENDDIDIFFPRRNVVPALGPMRGKADGTTYELNAYIDPKEAEGAGRFIEEYAKVSQEWSPRGHEIFHRSIGAMILSIVGARRIHIRHRRGIYPSLYLGLVAETSAYAKSYTMDVARELFERAGLGWLYFPERSMTPARFMQISGRNYVDPEYGKAKAIDRERIWNEVAFAGKRAMLFDEFGTRFNSIATSSGIYGQYLDIFLRWDNSPRTDGNDLVSRNPDIVEGCYLSMIAAFTPDNVKKMPKGASNLWTNGFFPRMILLTPPEGYSLKPFKPGLMEIPNTLVEELHDFHIRLGIPLIDIVEVKDSAGTILSYQVERDHFPEKDVEMTREAFQAYNTYHDAMTIMTNEKSYGVHPELKGNYTRFADKVLKLAALIAAMENNFVLDFRQWAYAQTLAEKEWRPGLHEFYRQVNSGDISYGKHLEDRIIDHLCKLGWAMPSELAGPVGIKTGQVAQYLDALVVEGSVLKMNALRRKPGRTPKNRPPDFQMVTIYGIKEKELPSKYILPGQNEARGAGQNEARGA